MNPIKRVRFTWGAIIYDIQCWRYLHAHGGFWRCLHDDFKWAMHTDVV